MPFVLMTGGVPI